MKVRASRRGLVDAMSLLMGVIPARSTKPILQNVRVRATKGGVELLATDLELGIRLMLDEVEIEETGDVLVPAARFHNVLRELGEDGVDLVTEGNTVRLTAGADRVEILGEAPGEFPDMPNFSDGREFRLPSRELRTLFRRTSFAVARETTRYALNGVLFDVIEGQVRVVATDGKRLALAETSYRLEARETLQALLPGRGVQQVERLVADSEEEVRLSLRENQIQVQTRRAEMICQLLEGQFPRYTDVVPKAEGRPIQLPRESFAALLRRAASLNTPEVQSVRLRLEAQRLVLASEVRDVGNTRVEMVVDYTGSPLEIAFNPQYLIEFLKVVEDPSVEAYLTRSDAPGLFHGGQGYRYVIMPMSLT